MTRWNGKIVTTFAPVGASGAGTRLGQWDGISFTSIPGDSIGFGTSGAVGHVGAWGTKLIATGNFPNNGSLGVPDLVTYDGSQWGTIGEPWSAAMTGPDVESINDMIAWGGKLMVSGPFGVVADQDHWSVIRGVAAWDGTHWSALGAGAVGAGIWLGTYAGDLVIMGQDMSVLGGLGLGVASWNGSAWTRLGTSSPEWADASAEFQSKLYMNSGTAVPFPLSSWDGSTWSAVAGMDDPVYALAQAGGRLVVGGEFTLAGGLSSPNVAFYDGASWHAAGAGVNGIVLAAAEWLGQPVIGGEFTASGSTPLPGVAMWDGSQWQPMGTHAVEVEQMRVIDGELFATGDFRLPDESVAETIAHWTGSDWRVLGSGGNGYPFAHYNGFLYQQGVGLVHGHPSHNLSRVSLGAVLDVPRPQASAHIALAVSPNPARGRAAFSFTLPTAGHARVTVLDLAGRRVATLADGAFATGPHQAQWATPGAPGVYMAILETSAGRVSRRFVVTER